MSSCEILPFGATLPDTVVFDLDGTLIDSAPDLTGALNATLATLGLAAIPEAEVRHMVGHGARKLIERGLEAHAVAKTAAEVDALVEIFIRYYASHVADRSVVFPGVVATLNWLKARGVKLGVCTNKPEALAKQVLIALELDGYFPAAAILGGDSLAVKKPDGRHLIATVEALDGNLDRTVMVGDSATDLNAARDAGVPTVLVSFGYTPIPARELGADAVIDHFGDLAKVLPEVLDRSHARL
ncbi:phosphoglycolate phosphatase [Zavarzinia compransoris]|uniref:Phosphoglycolate phosphatase n=1 Tax=Zavarzinia compransoris TaxID=1264899 RepID=A0A317ED03_9PROT|nr:phosphoglycolate phosphatase [Zavarzinia compransoris]PWR23095.1 phosphoglycolate phosphatase [Zavarzinia compransoris]TDP46355.1 phosphoglycolate phosphatase [Zavarzinia compransoris]